MTRRRAIILISGGLDSTLAIELMREQGVDLTAIHFVGPFCVHSPGGRQKSLAMETAKQAGVTCKVQNLGREYLKMVEHPRFGYGRGMNPCVDCKIFMLHKAKQLLPELGGSFVVTGEVLGQRPMSQHMQALRRIEKESGLEGYLLRPLSAHLLAPTIPEQEGWVDRSRMLSIRGRSRKDQIKLAAEKQIRLFAAPAGGCLLTDPVIATRLRDLFKHQPDYNMIDARLLTLGRHFRIHEGLKAIVGHNQQENEILARLGENYAWMEISNRAGPFMVICGRVEPGDKERLGRLLRFYAKKSTEPQVELRLTQGDHQEEFVASAIATADELESLRIA